MNSDEFDEREFLGGQSPPDDNHPYVGGKDYCDSVIERLSEFGAEITCWHGDNKKSSACQCICHVPGINIKHSLPCCNVFKNPSDCPCRRCLEESNTDAWWMILCQKCGNKRCPHANDHRNECTQSNEPGQPGSAY